MKGSISAGCVAITIAGVLLASCARRTVSIAAQNGTPAPATVDQSIEPPDGLEPEVVQMHRGEAQRRADLSLDQIVALLPRPPFVPVAAGAEAPAAATDSTDAPPLVAQKHYLAARMAWRRELRFQAISELKRAHILARQSPQILRFLGQIYDERGSADQSYDCFEKAARLAPNDPYTIFMLCRHLARQGRQSEAIVGLAHLADIARGESRLGFLPLVSANLADALWSEGYDLAATEQWRVSLEQQFRFERLAGSLRDEAIDQHREKGLTWRQIGDACHRLGRPLQALEAYSRAAPYFANGRGALIRRLTFTFLRLGRPQLARQAVVDLLAAGRIEARDLALVNYLVRSGVDNDILVPPLRRIAVERDRPTVLVLAVARLLEPEERVAWLRDHLAVRPADRQVYEQLISLHFSDEWDPGAEVEALQTAAAVIEAFPKATEAYISTLIRLADSPQSLLEAIESLDPDQRRLPMTHYLRGRVLSEAGLVDEAVAAYREAIRTDASSVESRLALAELLIDHGRFEEAAQVLDPVSQVADDRVIALRLNVLGETGHTEEALRLVNDALAASPNSEPLVLRKAQLERESGNVQAAEFALNDLLHANPTSQRVYEALIDLYLEEQPTDWRGRHKKLCRRASQHLPHARVTRRETARMMLLDRKSDREAIETILRDLLKENPGDHRSVGLLMQLLITTERADEAEALLDKQLLGNQPPREARMLAEQFFVNLAFRYLRQGQLDAVIEMVDRAVQKPIRDPRLLLEIQRQALMDSDRADQIEPKLRAAIERFPDLEASLLLPWAMTLEQRDDHARAEQIMVELLQKFPDHADTNNSLGYTWADRNQRLDEAEQMIKRAVASEPLNPSYLDSLGWVYYKRGRFKDAIEILSKAMMQPRGRHPVILDHFGDALFRMDRGDEAVHHWQDALEGASGVTGNPEVQKIPARVQKKINALKTKQPVPVAEAPGAK